MSNPTGISLPRYTADIESVGFACRHRRECSGGKRFGGYAINQQSQVNMIIRQRYHIL